MARKRRGNKRGPIGLPKLIDKKKGRGGDSSPEQEETSAARCVLEFPKPPDEVVSDRIIFDIGGDRFALHWRAEIERLLPAAPILVEQKRGAARPRYRPLQDSRRN